MSRDVVAVITDFDQRSSAAMILGVGQTRNEHAPGQGIRAVWSNRATCQVGKIVDRLNGLRPGRISVHIEDEDAAGVETCQPELAAIVGESAVMGFVAPINGNTANNFPVRRRAGFYIDRDKFVSAVTHSFHAKRPHVNELFLTVDAGEIR